MEFINYIRNLFSFQKPTRKRKVLEEFNEVDFSSSPKFRRIQSTYNHMDDIIISPGVVRRPMRNSRNNMFPKEIIVLDDDIPKNQNYLRRKYTSTPSDNKTKEVSFQDDDDIKFVSEYEAETAKNKSSQIQFSKPFTLLENIIPNKQSEYSNNRKLMPISRINSLQGIKKRHLTSYTTRLEDKRKFQNLLESHLSMENSMNNSSQYFTPNSRLSKYDYSSRGKKILDLSKQNDSICASIDLTQEEHKGNSSSKKMSVRDRIKKVISDFEEELVEIQDSESDVEILPNPPSPEPDIKVEPVNSMKTVVQTSYVSNKQWLADIVANHQKKIDDRQKEIKILKESSKKCSDINRDIRLGHLCNQVDKCLQIKNAVLPIEEEEPELPQLKPEHYAKIDKAFRGNPGEVLVKKFNLNITRKDIMTLAGLNWLNDEVINFYMNLIIERSENGSYPKAHCFNTFFYPKLLRDGPESLRRWTRRVDLFSMDIICVPIHLGVHWCMAIIDFRNKSIKYYDSMGSCNPKCLNALRNYLQSEHMDKKKSSYDTSAFHLESVKDIPQQMNGSDCGMFSCTFAEFYSRDAKFTFKQEDMPYLRSKMVIEILSGELMIK